MELTWLTALLPVVGDGLRGLFNRLTGGAGAQPANVDEVIKLEKSNTERLQALAKLDEVSGNVSGWVANVRAMQRPTATLLIIVAYVYSINIELAENVQNQIGAFAEMAFFYLFGDRINAHLKRGK